MPDTLGPWGKASAGAAAAILANAIVYPLDIVKTKLQIQSGSKPKALAQADAKTGPNIDEQDKEEDHQHYKGTIDALVQIYGTKGLPGLYHGMVGSLIGTGSSNFAYFYWYGVVRALYLKSNPNGAPFSTAVELALGAIAGALGQLFTIPISVVTTRQQTDDKTNAGIFGTAASIIEDDGITGLWRGLKASLVLVINPSITYGAAERIRTVIFNGNQHLAPAESFMVGAMSKSMATLATQPMIVAKVMQQSKINGKSYNKSMLETILTLARTEGLGGLFKGLGPQITKGIIVQGLLFMFKDQVELLILALVKWLSRRKRIALK